MERRIKQKMLPMNQSSPPDLLSLPDAALLEILRHLDGRSLAQLRVTAKYFNGKEPLTGLPLAEHIAKESVLRICKTSSEAERFRRRSWCERLYLEKDASCDFDRQQNESSGYRFNFSPEQNCIRNIQLTGMGPKLLVSKTSTSTQSVLRWQLRVRGNTAVEFGVIPSALEPSHTALHKCLGVPSQPQERAIGFCSQITAGSLLPLKAPVLRGTVLDIVACRGHMEVVLRYPDDAKEITWHNGQPIHKPYRGPRELRLEQDFSPDYDVRLALTSWAKGSFDVLHQGFEIDPAWAMECSRHEAGLRFTSNFAAAEPQTLAAAARPDREGEAPLAAAAALEPPPLQPPFDTPHTSHSDDSNASITGAPSTSQQSVPTTYGSPSQQPAAEDSDFRKVAFDESKLGWDMSCNTDGPQDNQSADPAGALGLPDQILQAEDRPDAGCDRAMEGQQQMQHNTAFCCGGQTTGSVAEHLECLGSFSQPPCEDPGESDHTGHA